MYEQQGGQTLNSWLVVEKNAKYVPVKCASTAFDILSTVYSLITVLTYKQHLNGGFLLVT